MLRAKKLLISVLTLVLISVFCFGTRTLIAGEKKEATDPDKKRKSVSAMKVGKDVGEKTTRPITKKEDKVLSERLQKKLNEYPPHQVKTRTDGTKALVVAPQFLNFSVATVGKDGKVKHTCYKGEKTHEESKQEPEE